MKARFSLAIVALLAGALAAAASSSFEPSNYGALPGHKAIAATVDDPSIRGVASGESSDASASVTALQKCTALRRPDVGVCEVVRLNDAKVTRASEIRAAVPRTPHPLFLWQFDAGASRVYLAGSIHVMKESLLPLPAQFENAFQQAHRLAVEVNTNGLAPDVLQQKFRSYALLPAGQSISAVLRPATLASVTTHLQNQSMSLAGVAAMKPVMLATQLAVARLTALGYLPEFGLEQHFMAAAGNRPILELETLDEQLEVLTSPPIAVQDEMLAETIDQMATIEPVISAMIVAWMAGDDREFRRLFDLQTGSSADVQAFMRRLLEDRNVGMADRIEGFLTQPGTTFVLVGTAHLTGPEGIVALLEARGLSGRRINSNDSI